jgi:putative transposase
MSIPRRRSSPKNVAAGERTFFVTASTWGKRSLLQSSRAADLFIRTLLDYRDQRKYQLHDFVVMPDHFHILITVDADITIEQVIQLVKGGFSFRAGKELGFKPPVWQKGFSEIRVLDLERFENQRRYIRNNPVIAHLAETAEQYFYSSAHEKWALDPPPLGLTPIFLSELCGAPEEPPEEAALVGSRENCSRFGRSRDRG